MSRSTTYISIELNVFSAACAGIVTVYSVSVEPEMVTGSKLNAGSTFGCGKRSNLKVKLVSACPSGTAAVNVNVPPFGKLNG